MSDCIKLNKGNIDVCEREVIVLREIIAAAMGRLHQMRKQQSAAMCLRRISRMRWMRTE